MSEVLWKMLLSIGMMCVGVCILVFREKIISWTASFYSHGFHTRSDEVFNNTMFFIGGAAFTIVGVGTFVYFLLQLFG